MNRIILFTLVLIEKSIPYMARLFNRILLILTISFSLSSGLYAAPKVSVTLKPIHSLVASVMEGVGSPTLLLPDGASPHTYQLKPSTLKTLIDADLIVWVGPSLETFMVKPLSTLKPQYGFVEIDKLPNLLKLPLREGREWGHANTEHAHDHGDDHDHHHGDFDPHVWLSNANAQTIVKATAERLIAADPSNAKRYQANTDKTLKQLQALKVTLQSQLAKVQAEPFLVYHDGYQYFEKDFNLNAAGTMVINPHVPLSAHGLAQIKALIGARDVKCIFKETEFSEKIIENSLGMLPVNIKELDPLGARIPQGPQHYEQTLLQLGKTVQECLQPKINKGSSK